MFANRWDNVTLQVSSLPLKFYWTTSQKFNEAFDYNIRLSHSVSGKKDKTCSLCSMIWWSLFQIKNLLNRFYLLIYIISQYYFYPFCCFCCSQKKQVYTKTNVLKFIYFLNVSVIQSTHFEPCVSMLYCTFRC